MECILRGRMPFGYAHIVQVLVNLISWLYPVMAFSSGMSFQMGVLGVIFLTMTYQGLIDLSKRFLDPFHNEVRAVRQLIFYLGISVISPNPMSKRTFGMVLTR